MHRILRRRPSLARRRLFASAARPSTNKSVIFQHAIDKLNDAFNLKMEADLRANQADLDLRQAEQVVEAASKEWTRAYIDVWSSSGIPGSVEVERIISTDGLVEVERKKH